MNYETAISTLTDRYIQIFKNKGNAPQWAVHKTSEPEKLVHCPIPFVGKEYFEQNKKLLVYASAENLVGYKDYLDNDSFALNRHRLFFEKSKSHDGYFFPNVHIQPFNDGVLSIVALYVMSKISSVSLGGITPSDFYEKIAFANFGKYSIQFDDNGNRVARNCDYATVKSKMNESADYIKADIEVLKPDCIIIVKSIAQTNNSLLKEILPPETQQIRICQLVPRTINTIIRKSNSSNLNNVNATVLEWFDHLGAESEMTHRYSNKTKENFKSVFPYINKIM